MKQHRSLLVLTLLLALPCIAGADPVRTLSGTVLDRDGKAVAGAEVAVWTTSFMALNEDGVPATASAITDAEGRWSVPVLATDSQFTFNVWKPGSILSTGTVVAPAGAVPPVRKTTLFPATLFKIRLVDWKNQPAKNGVVRFQRRDATRGRSGGYGRYAGASGMHFEPEVRASDDGWVTLPFGMLGDRLTVQVSATGCQTILAGLYVPRDEGLALRLAPEAVLGGRLTDPDGQPIADVPVTVFGGSDQTKTGPDGRFLLHGQDESSVFLRLKADNLTVPPTPLPLRRDATVDAGDIVASPGTQVSGTVTGFRPMDPNGDVALIRFGLENGREEDESPGQWSARAVAGRDGKFSLRLPAGAYSAVCFTGEDEEELQVVRRKIVVKPGEPLELNFAPSAAPGGPQAAEPVDYVYGSVQGPDGAKISGASVGIYQGTELIREAKTNLEGKFALGPLRGDVALGGNAVGLARQGRNAALPVYIRASGSGLVSNSVLVDQKQDKPLTINLIPRQKLNLRILKPGEEPERGARVVLTKTTAYVPGENGPLPVPIPPEAGHAPEARSDGMGRVSFDKVSVEGFCTLHVEHPEYADFDYTVALPRDEAVDLRLYQPATIQGRILLEGQSLSAPRLGVLVQARYPYRLFKNVLTSPDGYSAEKLPPREAMGVDNLMVGPYLVGSDVPLGPGLVANYVKMNRNWNVVITDTRQQPERRWLIYVTSAPAYEEGGTVTCDLAAVPMALIKGKLDISADRLKEGISVSYKEPSPRIGVYQELPTATPDAAGNFQLWVPSGKEIQLEVRNKGAQQMDSPLWTLRMADVQAHEAREVVFPCTPETEYFRDQIQGVRLVGPDGATVPRGGVSIRAVGSWSSRPRQETAQLDGFIYTYVPDDATQVEVSSPLLDAPRTWSATEFGQLTVLKVDKVPAPLPDPSRALPGPSRPLSDPVQTPSLTRPDPTPPGQIAPELKVTKWARGPVSLAGLRGKVVVLSPHAYQMQTLLPLIRRYGSNLVLVILPRWEGGYLLNDYEQMLDWAFKNSTPGSREALDKAVIAIGLDPSVDESSWGYNARALGMVGGSTVIDTEGRIAAGGLSGAELTAKVGQVAGKLKPDGAPE